MADYYESSNVEIFPSSNASDSGKITSEENLRAIVLRITNKNYVLHSDEHPQYNPNDPKDLDFHLTINNDGKIEVSPGLANIYGYDILTYSSVVLTNPTINGNLKIVIGLQFDGQGPKNGGHVIGDISNVTSTGTTYYCGGLYLTFKDNSIELEDYELLLGTVNFDGSNFSDLVENPDKYTRIDSSNIEINNNEFNSNNLEELVSELLDTFIMRDGSNRLNGQGGNFYGSLLGRNKEDSSNYRIKINLDNTDSQEIEFKTLLQTENKYKSSLGTDNLGPFLTLGNNILRYTSDNFLTLSGDPFKINSETYINNDTFISNGNIGLSVFDDKFIIGTITYNSEVEPSGGAIINEATNNSISTTLSVNENSILSSYDGNSLNISSTTGSNINFLIDTIFSKIKIQNSGSNNWTEIYKDVLNYDTDNLSIKFDSTKNSLLTYSKSSEEVKIVSANSYDNPSSYSSLSSNGSANFIGNLPLIYLGQYDGSLKNRVRLTLSTSLTNTLVINSDNGNANLSVTGDITANRVFNAVYNDIVEFMEKDENEVIESGDLICVREDEKFHKISSTSDIEKFIGVCSSEKTYGYALGGDGLKENQKIPVGLTGRVYVKVSDPLIKPGDNLTIDGLTFKATRATSSTHKIIGKAVSHVKDNKVYMLIK